MSTTNSYNKLAAQSFSLDKTLEQAAWPLQTSAFEKEDQTTFYVGAGTCGLGAGAEHTYRAIENYIQQHGLNAKLIKVGCIGLCSSEPIVDIKLPGKPRISFEKITNEKVDELLDQVLAGQIDHEKVLGQFPSGLLNPWPNTPFVFQNSFFGKQQRIVLEQCGIIDPCSITDFVERGGFESFKKVITTLTPFDVCDLIEKSGLRGRGGGGFLTGKKWKFALQTAASQKYFICNADEGDPGAFMDRAVIEGDPFKLVEGLAIAAYAIGATKAYVYIRAEYPLAIERLIAAIEMSKKHGFLGENILGTDVQLDIIIKKGAGAFVCGEETALIHSIEGKRGMPRPRPPYPAVSGLNGKPTVINNVETLANLPWIIKWGAGAFSEMGTAQSKGTKVFALSGKVTKTGLIEVAMGTSIRDIIFEMAGGILDQKKFKAVQMGGPSGGCVTTENLDIPVDYESLLQVGAMMGSGGMVVMDENTCMVDVAKFFMDFIQRESCGKCIPCREGTRRMLDILELITKRPEPNTNEALIRHRGMMELERLAKVIQDTSLCGLGQSAPNPVLSTLRWFKDEYESHVYERVCQAGVCQSLKIYKIDTQACTGCTLCAKKCPTGAIIGTKKSPHFIVDNKCIACGACFEVCKFDSVLVL